MATGIAVAAFLMLTGRDPYMGLNAGFHRALFQFCCDRGGKPADAGGGWRV